MWNFVDPEQLGMPVARIPGLNCNGDGSSNCSCALCTAPTESKHPYRPAPLPGGNLRVDPEIKLPSPGFDVDIAYYYNTNATFSSGSVYGLGRTISTNLTAQASGSPLIATILRGTGSAATYQHDGSGSFGPANFTSPTQQNLNTLQKDSVNDLWLETAPDGRADAYPFDNSGLITSIAYSQDAIGNRHTFAYDSGLLNTLQDSVGRFVTFGYASNRLESIEDWAGRRTTFQYDDSIPARPVLATVIGPSGCQTGYGYDDGARLTRITDPNGYDTTYAYDIADRVTLRGIAGGGTTQYDYSSGALAMTLPDGAIVTNLSDSNYNVRGLMQPDGVPTTVTYNPKGLQTSKQDYYGAITTSIYDSANLLTAQIDALGRITTWQRDIYNNITTTIFADGTSNQALYGYPGSPFDTSGARRRVQAQIDALGNRTSFGYTGRGQLASVQDALGARTTFGYDDFGNPNLVVNALGANSTRLFDLAGNMIASVDALGYRTTIGYDPQNRPLYREDALGNRTSMGYDSVGNLLVSIDALGYRTSNAYDVYNHITAVQDALGNRTTNGYDSSGRLTVRQNALGARTSVLYDIVGRPIATIDALGNISTTVYDAVSRPLVTIDALGRRTTIVFDLLGRTQATIDALGYRTTNIYDNRNRPIATVDAAGYATSNIYDAASRPIGTIDALGRIATTLYDALNRPIASIDALGSRNTNVFDVLGRTVANIDALGYASSALYDVLNRPIATIDALGYRTSTAWDAVGQLVGTQNALGATATNVWDARGRLLAYGDVRRNRTTYGYDPVGRRNQQNQMYGSQSLFTTWQWDAAGQLAASIDASSFRTSTVFDVAGRLSSMQNALGRRTTNIYDAVSNRTNEQNALGAVTTLSYDPLDRLITVEDANGNRTSTAYDSRSLQLSEQLPWGAITTNSYDPVGNLSLRIDGRGLATTNSYDRLDRLSNAVHHDGTRTTNSYDALSRATTVWNETALITTIYDPLSRTIQSAVQNVADGVATSLAYSFDGVGNRLLLVDGEGHRTTCSYERVSSLVNQLYIQPPYETALSSIRFDKRGDIDFKELFNNAASRDGVRYLPNQWLSNRGYTGPGNVEQDIFIPNYDAAGNRIRIAERNGGATSPYTLTYFAYDEINQLISERRQDTTGYATTYGYDPVGNRLTANSLGALTTLQYAPGNLLVSEQSQGALTTYSHDQAGNRSAIDTAGGRTTFQWDSDDRLVGVQNPDGSSEELGYDGAGTRRRRVLTPAVGAAVTTNFVYDGYNLNQERDENGLITAAYAWGPERWDTSPLGHFEGGEVDNTLLMQRRVLVPGDLAGGVSSYFGCDPSFNNRLVFDTAGNVTDRLIWKAFGELFAHSGSTVTPYGFGGAVGYYLDVVNRLNVTWRVYDPIVGRWISLDPLGFGGGDWNPFGYVGNAPVGRIDASGLRVPGEPGYDPYYDPYTDPRANPDATGAPPTTPRTKPKKKPKRCLVVIHLNPLPNVGLFPSLGIYGHAYIHFNGICAGTHSIGFHSEDSGQIQAPDTSAKPNYGKDVLCSNDPAFAAALCGCIKNSIDSPPMYALFSVCGSWTSNMWNCALTKLGRDPLLGSGPID